MFDAVARTKFLLLKKGRESKVSEGFLSPSILSGRWEVRKEKSGWETKPHALPKRRRRERLSRKGRFSRPRGEKEDFPGKRGDLSEKKKGHWVLWPERVLVEYSEQKKRGQGGGWKRW